MSTATETSMAAYAAARIENNKAFAAFDAADAACAADREACAAAYAAAFATLEAALQAAFNEANGGAA